MNTKIRCAHFPLSPSQHDQIGATLLHHQRRGGAVAGVVVREPEQEAETKLYASCIPALCTYNHIIIIIM